MSGPAGEGREVLLEARGLSRSFGGVPAVQGVDLHVARGDIVAFVGKNGAGKTTTLRMLAGALAPTSGEIRRAGPIGYAPETPQLDPDLTVREQLMLAAALRGLGGKSAEREIGRVMGTTDVGNASGKLTSTLSKGTKQRVGLAQALIGAPPILLLDEPGAGLDPAQLRNLRMTLSGLSADHAILLSTHHVADIVETCTRVLALARGRVVLDQPRSALGADPERAVVRVLVDEPGLAGAGA